MPTDYAIKDGRTVFDATTYAGNSTARSITNAGSFKPDLVWIKSRSNAEWHGVYDSNRGVAKTIFTNATDAESVNNTGGYITAFNSDGYSVTAGATSSNGVNQNGYTYVAWQWQAGQGTNTTNTSGSITSTVSVNQTAGFSVVTYAGNSTAGATIGHGLGVAPKFMVIRLRNTTSNWIVYHQTLGNANTLNLNTTGASASSSAFNSTSPTSTLVTLGGASTGTNDTGYNFVAYCWAEVAGFSKFGSYTGNGSTDGTFVYLGFRPKFIMVKRTDASTNWWMMDTSRNTSNVMGQELYPNISAAEAQWTGSDFLSNGIKFRTTDVAYNVNGANYVYMAFAENPFKYSLAR